MALQEREREFLPSHLPRPGNDTELGALDDEICFNRFVHYLL
jgi:hypothetical protein